MIVSFICFFFGLNLVHGTTIKIINNLNYRLRHPRFDFLNGDVVEHFGDINPQGEAQHITINDRVFQKKQGLINLQYESFLDTRYYIGFKFTSSQFQIGFYLGAERDHLKIFSEIFKDPQTSLLAPGLCTTNQVTTHGGWQNCEFLDGSLLTYTFFIEEKTPFVLINFRENDRTPYGSFLIQNVKSKQYLSTGINSFPAQPLDPENISKFIFTIRQSQQKEYVYIIPFGNVKDRCLTSLYNTFTVFQSTPYPSNLEDIEFYFKITGTGPGLWTIQNYYDYYFVGNVCIDVNNSLMYGACPNNSYFVFFSENSIKSSMGTDWNLIPSRIFDL